MYVYAKFKSFLSSDGKQRTLTKHKVLREPTRIIL